MEARLRNRVKGLPIVLGLPRHDHSTAYFALSADSAARKMASVPRCSDYRRRRVARKCFSAAPWRRWSYAEAYVTPIRHLH